MESLISVIVPVYNSEQHICSCVESVLRQTYSLFEIILIEDGSEDNSLNVCGALCKKDKRIRLIRQVHKGVSAARNLGIEAAKGKYLFFLDSDDLIHPQLLEALYKLQEMKHSAIALEGMHYGKDGASPQIAACKIGSCYVPGSIYLNNKMALKYINKPVVCTIGGKMISRKAINTVRFKEDLSHSEDKLFIYQLLANGADISVLCCNWYYYRMHKSNASRVYNTETCQSRYRVECYIFNHEIKSGRKENAIYRERDIAVLLVDWYKAGRMCRNVDLMKYIRNLAKRERKRKIFRYLSMRIKLYFYLSIFYYPLYEEIQKVSKKLRKLSGFIESRYDNSKVCDQSRIHIGVR